MTTIPSLIDGNSINLVVSPIKKMDKSTLRVVLVSKGYHGQITVVRLD